MGWKEDLEERRSRAAEARKKAGRKTKTKDDSGSSFLDYITTKTPMDAVRDVTAAVRKAAKESEARNKKRKADADKKYGDKKSVTVTKTTVTTDDPFKGLDMTKDTPKPEPKKKAEPKKDTYEGEPRTIAEAKRMGKSYFINKAGKKLAAVTREDMQKANLNPDKKSDLTTYLNKKAGKAAKGMYATKNRTGAHDYRAGGMLMSVEDRRKMK